MGLLRNILRRFHSCLVGSSASDTHVLPGQDSSVQPVGAIWNKTPAPRLLVGARVEAIVEYRAVRPPEQNILLRKAEHNPGFWYPCVILSVSNTKVMVRFDGTSDPKLDVWVPKALVRRCCRSDNLACKNARPAAGTLVEIQVPDRWGSDGVADRWSWWPGVVQVYSRRRAESGRVMVALDLSSECLHRQLEVPRERLRVVLPAGTRVRVEGAGIDAVNGIYEAVGFHDGVPMFECQGVALVRCGLPSGSRFWYLADKSRIDVDDGDYYRIYSADELPPTTSCDQTFSPFRWIPAMDGAEPVPSISLVSPPDDSASSEDAGPASSPAKAAAHAPLMCPICHHEFPPGEDSSEQINAHVDACLEIKGRRAEAAAARAKLKLEPVDRPADGDASSSDSDGEKPCIVCLDGRADCAAIPCGHMCLCEDCAYELKSSGSACPICRRPVLFTQRIFS